MANLPNGITEVKLSPEQLEQTKLCARLAAELALASSVKSPLEQKIKRQLDEQFEILSAMLEPKVERLKDDKRTSIGINAKLSSRIEAALALHKPGPDGYCTECADPTRGECDTIKTLTGRM